MCVYFKEIKIFTVLFLRYYFNIKSNQVMIEQTFKLINSTHGYLTFHMLIRSVN